MGRGLNAFVGLTRMAAKSARKSLREQERAERQYEREQRQLEKQNIINSNYNEYVEHIEYLQSLTTLHEDVSEPIDWNSFKSAQPPVKPEKNSKNEIVARKKYDEFKPGFFDKFFGRGEKKRIRLFDNIREAQERDEKVYKFELKEYQEAYKEWKTKKDLAIKILEGNKDSFNEVLDLFKPMEELEKFNCDYSFFFSKEIPEIEIGYNSGEVIPSESKTFLKSGKLSVKEMSKLKYNEYWRDHICSSVFYTVHQVFAHLPVESIIITALDYPDKAVIKVPILSVKFDLENFLEIDHDVTTPFESLSSFKHNIKFKKSTGFYEVNKIT